jgi:hypothetical protein
MRILTTFPFHLCYVQGASLSAGAGWLVRARASGGIRRAPAPATPFPFPVSHHEDPRRVTRHETTRPGQAHPVRAPTPRPLRLRCGGTVPPAGRPTATGRRVDGRPLTWSCRAAASGPASEAVRSVSGRPSQSLRPQAKPPVLQLQLQLVVKKRDAVGLLACR